MFFIVGCGRSGTTAVTDLLRLSPNLHVVSEKLPYLSIENNLLSNGIGFDTSQKVEEFLKGDLRRESKLLDPCYGEKQVSLGPFISEIYKRTKAKFIYVHRDGREVVQSFMTWHNVRFGSIYRESGENNELFSKARRSAYKLLTDYDHNELSRPRELGSISNVDRWLKMSRFEMLSYMWAEVNKSHISELKKIPSENIFRLNINSFDHNKAEDLFSFLDQKTPSSRKIKALLSKRVNSIENRKFGKSSDKYASWPFWDQDKRESFTLSAGSVMKSLGYWEDFTQNWKPHNYATFWEEKTDLYEWYKWMYESREEVHKQFFAFLENLKQRGTLIKSVTDIGCGIGYGYTNLMKDFVYTGLDLSVNAINLANELNHSSSQDGVQHQFICTDFLKNPIKWKSDIVISSGTIDNCYDIPLFLKRMVSAANKYIYLTAYRGWFPETLDHKYDYHQKGGYFNNTISPHATYNCLKDLGCTEININYIWTNSFEIPFETEITAKVPAYS